MLKRILPQLFTVLVVLGAHQSMEAQLFKKKKNKTEEAKEAKPKEGEIQPYEKVITKEAVSDSGLFTVHRVRDKYYYEIPDSLLTREMLMVTRIAKTATGIGFGGGKINTKVLRWEKRPRQILLRVASYENVAADSLPIHEAVVNSNFEPVLFAFD